MIELEVDKEGSQGDSQIFDKNCIPGCVMWHVKGFLSKEWNASVNIHTRQRGETLRWTLRLAWLIVKISQSKG